MDAKWTLYFVLAATMSIMMGISDKPCIKDGVCSLMAKCNPGVPGHCAARIDMTVLNSTNITFVLSDNSSGYIAVGFSVDNQTTGQSTVYGCTNDSGVIKLIHANLNNSILTEVNSSTGKIQGMMNASGMSCNFTVNDPIVADYLQNGSYISFISGNFINGTLGPVTRFPTNSLRDVIVSSLGAKGNNTNATALGANSTSAATPSSTTSTKPSTIKASTTSTKPSTIKAKPTQLASNKTTTSTNLANPGNPSSMGNNALQPNAARATFILLGAVMVALFSG